VRPGPPLVSFGPEPCPRTTRNRRAYSSARSAGSFTAQVEQGGRERRRVGAQPSGPGSPLALSANDPSKEKSERGTPEEDQNFAGRDRNREASHRRCSLRSHRPLVDPVRGCSVGPAWRAGASSVSVRAGRADRPAGGVIWHSHPRRRPGGSGDHRRCRTRRARVAGRSAGSLACRVVEGRRVISRISGTVAAAVENTWRCCFGVVDSARACPFGVRITEAPSRSARPRKTSASLTPWPGWVWTDLAWGSARRRAASTI
jgi:hypothetical protein